MPKYLTPWIIGLLVLVLGPISAFSTPPAIAPYGASRGRMRYVEGPYRTKERVRWGNGITPVGGQVLIHGLTVAGQVADSAIQSGALGTRSVQEQKEIDNFWAGRRGEENQLLTQLNLLRKGEGLQGDVAYPTTTFSVPGSSPGPTVSDSPKDPQNHFDAQTFNDAFKKDMKASVDVVIAIRSYVTALGDKSAPNDDIQNWLAHVKTTFDLKDFAPANGPKPFEFSLPKVGGMRAAPGVVANELREVKAKVKDLLARSNLAVVSGGDNWTFSYYNAKGNKAAADELAAENSEAGQVYNQKIAIAKALDGLVRSPEFKRIQDVSADSPAAPPSSAPFRPTGDPFGDAPAASLKPAPPRPAADPFGDEPAAKPAAPAKPASPKPEFDPFGDEPVAKPVAPPMPRPRRQLPI